MENIYLCITSWSLFATIQNYISSWRLIRIRSSRGAASRTDQPLTTTAQLLRTGASSGWFRAPCLHNAVPWFGQDGTQNNPPKPGRGLWIINGNSNTTLGPVRDARRGGR